MNKVFYLIISFLLSLNCQAGNFAQVTILKQDQASNLVKDINLYESESLTNVPSVTIGRDKLIINNQSFSYSKVLECSKQEINEKCLSPFSFIDTTHDYLRIKIEQISEKKFRIKNKDKFYFTELDESYFKGNVWPADTHWIGLEGKNAHDSLSAKIKVDKDFEKFINDLNDCVVKESLTCLESFALDSKNIQRMFIIRNVAESSLCNKLLKITDYMPDEIDNELSKYKIKKSNVVWSNLKDLLSLNKELINVHIETNRFRETDRLKISLKQRKKLACENKVDLKLLFNKLDNGKDKLEWKIIYMDTYSRILPKT